MIKLFQLGHEIDFSQWLFPGKEVGVKLNIGNIDTNYKCVVHVLNPSSEELFIFFNLVNALKWLGVKKENIEVYLPYVPYGRQDRVCHDGESHALSVFAQTLKANAYWDTLIIDDPHSSATQAYLKSDKYELAVCSQDIAAYDLPKFDYLIAPDEGASKKLKLHKQVAEDTTIPIWMTKTRIDGVVNHNPLAPDIIVGSACVVDDICDGGATFLSIGASLRLNQPRMTSLNLYVTHGLFSKGTDKLLSLFDNIYTAHNFNSSVTNVKVI